MARALPAARAEPGLEACHGAGPGLEATCKHRPTSAFGVALKNEWEHKSCTRAGVSASGSFVFSTSAAGGSAAGGGAPFAAGRVRSLTFTLLLSC